MSTALPMVAVYADESCLGNGRDGDNPGGAGGLIEYRGESSREPTLLDYWISDSATTNNRMALRSAIEALRILSRKGRRLKILDLAALRTRAGFDGDYLRQHGHRRPARAFLFEPA